MNSHVDLKQLAVRRDGLPPRPSSRQRYIVTRYVLPGLVLTGFATVIGWAARDLWLPSKPVTVVPVITAHAEIQQAGTPLFQAAGWVEPRPTPVVVTALAEGVVSQLLVVEGQAVEAGEPVARLIDADARLALSSAEAELRLKQSEADALLAKTETDLLFIPFQLQAADAAYGYARRSFEGKEKLYPTGAIPEISHWQAKSELDKAKASADDLTLRKARLEREAKTLRQIRDSYRSTGTATVDAKEPLTEAEVNMKVAMARVAQARVAVDMARLRLERMTVRAPVYGRVLALVARPGARVMGQDPRALNEASTVVTLYDPQSLQVRADVPLDQVARVVPGQAARVETDALSGGFVQGEVLFATSFADIQKNTLQVKIALKDPPGLLKPEMLVRATFLAPATPSAAPRDSDRLRQLVPRQLVEGSDAGTHVWIADQFAGVARQRTVRLGTATSGDWVEVVEGLTPADKLIAAGREGLHDGERIRVTGEDSSLGSAATSSGAKASRLSRRPEGARQPKTMQ